MRRHALRAAVAAGAALALAAGSGTAFADNIQDTIADTSAGVTLVAGSPTAGTAAIKVVGNNSDGATTDPGCNWDTGESPLVLNIVTPSGVTATPDPLSITTCGVDVPISFTAASDAMGGAATVTIVSSPAGGGGYNNQVSIPITVVHSAPTNTKPAVSVTGVTAQAYEFGRVPAIGCAVVDAEDGADADATPVITGDLVNGLGTQTATCSYMDSGSPALSDTAAVTYSIVDTTDPTIRASLTSAVASTGWYNIATGAPTAEFTCDDVNSSGIATCSDDVLLTEGRDESATGTAVDHGGNSASATAGPVDIDLTAPNAPTADAGAADYAGADGKAWHKGSATITFTGTTDPALADGTAGSGIVATTTPVSRTTTGQLAASGTSTDAAGNTSPSTPKTVWVDTTAPQVVVGQSQSLVLNSSGKTVSWTASDADSGLAGAASGSVALDTSSVGTKTVTIPAATDNVGNVSAPQSYTYEVGYAYSALLQPINLDGRSSFKAGSTIPVKFQVVDANGVVQDVAGLAASLRVNKLDSVPDAAVNEAVLATAGDTGAAFRYDATGKQYIYNLSTKNWSGGALSEGTYRLDVVLGGKIITGGNVNIKK